MSKIHARLLSLIITIMLVIPISSLIAPAYDSHAETRNTPVLTISQEIETESSVWQQRLYGFEYSLTPETANCPLPDGAEGPEWTFELIGDAEQNVEFLIGDEPASEGAAAIRFYNGGIYKYKLAQSNVGRIARIDYDESEYDIYVKVATKRKLEIQAVWVQRETGDKPEKIQFRNRIRKATVIGDPPVNVVKRIEGDTPSEKDKFTFVMTPMQEDFPLPYGAVGEYETYIYGEGEVEIGNIEFEKPGFYEYRVWERANPELDYTFDKTVFMVSYDIREESDGSLSCERKITREDEADADESDCTFTNVYHDPSGGGANGDDPSGDDSSGDDPAGGSPEADDSSGGSGTSSRTGKGVITGDNAALILYIEVMTSAALILLAEHLRKKLKKQKIS